MSELEIYINNNSSTKKVNSNNIKYYAIKVGHLYISQITKDGIVLTNNKSKELMFYSEEQEQVIDIILCLWKQKIEVDAVLCFTGEDGEGNLCLVKSFDPESKAKLMNKSVLFPFKPKPFEVNRLVLLR